jgi:ATP-binding cassette subfamily B protein
MTGDTPGNGAGNGSGNGAGNNRAGDGSNCRDGLEEITDLPEELQASARAARAQGAGGSLSAGIPIARSEDLGASVRRLARRLRPDRGRVAAALALSVASVCLSVTGPRFLGEATNVVVAGVSDGNGIDYSHLHQLLLLTAAIYAGAYALQYAQAFTITGVVQRLMRGLRAEVEDKLARLPLAYIDQQPRGDLLSRVTNDIDNMAQSLQQSLSQMLSAALTITGSIVMMYTISPLLATITVLLVPCSLVVMKFITARSKKRFIAQWLHTGNLNGQVDEVFSGLALVQAYGRREDVQAVFEAENDQLYESSYMAQYISASVAPAMTCVGNLSFVMIAVLGSLQVASGQLSVGDIQAFIQYSRMFAQPLAMLASVTNVMQSGVASAERVFEFLDENEERPDPAAAVLTEEPRGRIEFQHVEFSYAPDEPLITDLNLLAEPGATIAIVGPTGAGKTTLVNLIMRFYEIDGGRITLDGHDIATMRRDELRRNIGMVLQDTWLFEGTIRDNIAFGRPGASEADIVAAARATHVDAFVRALPAGYDTLIDADGTNVSAGEKQLLTIARAFLSNPAILILDEATSSVDTRTEILIQQAMATLRTNRTSFVIAHRLSTIRDADTILVMEHGDIVEQGNHRELLAHDGSYAGLYNAQFAGAAAEVE